MFLTLFQKFFSSGARVFCRLAGVTPAARDALPHRGHSRQTVKNWLVCDASDVRAGCFVFVALMPYFTSDVSAAGTLARQGRPFDSRRVSTIVAQLTTQRLDSYQLLCPSFGQPRVVSWSGSTLVLNLGPLLNERCVQGEASATYEQTLEASTRCRNAIYWSPLQRHFTNDIDYFVNPVLNEKIARLYSK